MDGHEIWLSGERILLGAKKKVSEANLEFFGLFNDGVWTVPLYVGETC